MPRVRFSLQGFALILFVLCAGTSLSRAQTTFQRTYGDAGPERGTSVQQTSDGGYIVVGSTGFAKFGTDVYLIKTNFSGDTLWTRTYGGTTYSVGTSVQQTSDGGYIVAGGSGSFESGGAYLVKTNSSGDTLWTRTYHATPNSHANSVQQTSDSGYIIAGYTGWNGGGTDVYLIKTNSSGDTLWTRTYGGAGDEQGMSVQQTSDGGYIVVGYTWSFGAGPSDFYLIKTSSSGDTLWTRAFGGTHYEFGFSVQQTSDGGYIVAGQTYSFGAGPSDVYLIKTNSSGDTLWTRTYGGVYQDGGTSVQQTSDGGYIVAGYYTVFSGPFSSRSYLIKTNSSGDTLWTRTYGDTLGATASSVQQTSDGGYIVAGSSTLGYNNEDVYLIKTLGDGTVSVQEDRSVMPAGFALLQNYPNPFNPSTNIRFAVTGSGLVTLKVYDILGREVQTLVSENLQQGSYKATFDATGLASGVYLYRLESRGFSQTRKLILLR